MKYLNEYNYFKDPDYDIFNNNDHLEDLLLPIEDYSTIKIIRKDNIKIEITWKFTNNYSWMEMMRKKLELIESFCRKIQKQGHDIYIGDFGFNLNNHIDMNITIKKK